MCSLIITYPCFEFIARLVMVKLISVIKIFLVDIDFNFVLTHSLGMEHNIWEAPNKNHFKV